MEARLQKINNFINSLRTIRKTGNTSALVFSANNFSVKHGDNTKDFPLIITHTEQEAKRIRDLYHCDAISWVNFNTGSYRNRPILIDKTLLEYLAIELVDISYKYRDDISTLNKEIYQLKEEVNKFKVMNSILETKFDKIRNVISYVYPELLDKLNKALNEDLGEDCFE